MPHRGSAASVADTGDTTERTCVLFTLDGQLCGLPIAHVRDILNRFELTRIPLAPIEVAGNLNLRGRIVTAIDLGHRLSTTSRCDASNDNHSLKRTAIVVEFGGTLYALLVDHVQEVLSLAGHQLEPNPPSLPATWAAYSSGVVIMEVGLLALLDVERLLALDVPAS